MSSKSEKVFHGKNPSAGIKQRFHNLLSSFEDSTEKENDEKVADDYSIVESKLNGFKMETQTSRIGSTRDDASITQARIDGSNSVNDELNCVLNEKKLAVEEVDAGMASFGNEESSAPIGDERLIVSKQKVSFMKAHDIFCSQVDT